MGAGDFLCDGGECLINPAFVLEPVLAKNGNVILLVVPFTDELMIVFEGVLINRLIYRILDQPTQLVLSPHRQAALGLLLQKIGDLANDVLVTLGSTQALENIGP